MIKFIFLGAFISLCGYIIPEVASGLCAAKKDSVVKKAFNLTESDRIYGGSFQGVPRKLPGSIPTSGILKSQGSIYGTFQEIGPLLKAELEENTRQEIIDALLNRPRAVLFTGTHFKGVEERYEFGSGHTDHDWRGRCHTTEHMPFDVVMSPKPSWRSVKTFGTCVRLFLMDECQGNSVAIYPGVRGSTFSINDDRKYFHARSVGPCLEDEFKYASFSKVNGELVVRKDLSNPLQIRDQLDSFGSESWDPMDIELIENSTTLIRAVAREQGAHLHNRTNYIYLDITSEPPYCLESNPEEEIIREKEIKWEPFLQYKKEGDELGFLVPPKISGPPDELYNIFPQSRSNFRKWTEITDMVFNSLAVRNYRMAQEYLTIALFYEDELSTRPYGLYYYIKSLLSYEGPRIDYGFLYN